MRYWVKVSKEEYSDIINGSKRYMIINTDEIAVGCRVELREFNRVTREESGRKLTKIITHVTHDFPRCGLEKGYSIIGW